MSEQTMRDAFEATMRSKGFNVTRECPSIVDTYVSRDVGMAWEGWQAALSIAVPPAQSGSDGYADAFYKIAEVLEIGARDMAPMVCFETVMFPMIERLARTAAQGSDTNYRDELALGVARQFTQDTEPQRRARLQVAVREAIDVAMLKKGNSR